ncbi:hypothetical protein ACPW96_21695 [Micromonospora sp. DT81.3]|uniref:hypothetical protein n=1 Tax=Micromonospora sp. DT81.3 TaxID=3416523 RepID=UPI003CEB93F7
MARFSWRWVGLSLTVIGLGAAFLAVPLKGFPAEQLGLVLLWTGSAMFAGTLLTPVVATAAREVRHIRMYRALDRWQKNGGKPDEYPEWIRRHIYGTADAVLAPQWDIERNDTRMRFRNTGVDATVDLTKVAPLGPVDLDLDLELSLPAVIPQGASFALRFTDRRIGVGPYCAVLVQWTRPTGGEGSAVYYL